MSIENIIWISIIGIQAIITIFLIIRLLLIHIKNKGLEKYWENTPDLLPPFAACAIIDE